MKRTTAKLKMNFRFNTKLLLLIDLSQNALFVLFFIPLVNLLIEAVMNFMELSYITEENLREFLISPPAILLVLFLCISIPMFLLSRLSSLIYYCNFAGKHRRPYLFRIAFFGFFQSFRSLIKGNLGLLFFSLPFYMVSNLPILIGITFHADLGRRTGTQQELMMKSFIILFLILLTALSLDGIFSVHICTLGDLKFKQGFALSKKLILGHYKRTLTSYFIVNLLLTAGYFLLYYLLLFLTALFVCLTTNKAMAVTLFLAAYPRINLYFAAFYSIFAFIININLISSLYYSYQDESLRKLLPGEMVYPSKVTAINKRHKHSINAALILILSASLVNFYFTLHNDSLYLGDALTGIQISSHRGNSHIAPENTLPALENAIEAGSDYAEIDVQQTKDGALILLHDHSLLRTAGVKRYIWDMTLEEIKELDVGSWFGLDYSDTKIPTLEEVLDYCKGRIKLNIEVKPYDSTSDLETKLVAYIEQYDYVDQCVVSSTSYTSLVKIKELNEDIMTGYILSGVYGDFFDKEYIDFFSLRSSFITKNVVSHIHSAGKEVHAWTVNSSRELERMKTLDVDCVITDNPLLAREVLYRDDTNDSFIQMINRMINYRSLYSLSN